MFRATADGSAVGVSRGTQQIGNFGPLILAQTTGAGERFEQRHGDVGTPELDQQARDRELIVD
ncbi:MAG TPA: hypothetical protein VN628_14070, partial [Vicinamibacterales bacterium]|nr:hypothetical protein [Vicinamibacterales bacterium]